MSPSQEHMKLHYGVGPKDLPLSHARLLHILRGAQEAHHPDKLSRHFGWYGFVCFPCHRPIDPASIPGLRVDDANQACNRTAPVLLCETYARWLRPYPSDVGRVRILTKMFAMPQGGGGHPETTCSADMVEYARVRSANVCALVEETKNSGWIDYYEELSGERLYFLRPLFRAVAVVLRASDYSLQIPDVATVPVLVVRTGVEEDLRKTVDLEFIPEYKRLNTAIESDPSGHGRLAAVQTTLGTAIAFS